MKVQLLFQTWNRTNFKVFKVSKQVLIPLLGTDTALSFNVSNKSVQNQRYRYQTQSIDTSFKVSIPYLCIISFLGLMFENFNKIFEVSIPFSKVSIPQATIFKKFAHLIPISCQLTIHLYDAYNAHSYLHKTISKSCLKITFQ